MQRRRPALQAEMTRIPSIIDNALPAILTPTPVQYHEEACPMETGLLCSRTKLFVGQHKRVCLAARRLGRNHEVILMDELTGALDSRSTAAIEEFTTRLSAIRTIVFVIHNNGQAGRDCQRLAFVISQEGAGRCHAFGTVKENGRESRRRRVYGSVTPEQRRRSSFRPAA
jgi:ABC-type cobalamin/Fe3+-siderophores transport system ATPase subunit